MTNILVRRTDRKAAVAHFLYAGVYDVRYWDGNLLHWYALHRSRPGYWLLYKADGPNGHRTLVADFPTKHRALEWLETQG